MVSRQSAYAGWPRSSRRISPPAYPLAPATATDVMQRFCMVMQTVANSLFVELFATAIVLRSALTFRRPGRHAGPYFDQRQFGGNRGDESRYAGRSDRNVWQ